MRKYSSSLMAWRHSFVLEHLDIIEAILKGRQEPVERKTIAGCLGVIEEYKRNTLAELEELVEQTNEACD